MTEMIVAVAALLLYAAIIVFVPILLDRCSTEPHPQRKPCMLFNVELNFAGRVSCGAQASEDPGDVWEQICWGHRVIIQLEQMGKVLY